MAIVAQDPMSGKTKTVLSTVGKSLGTGIRQAATHSARAAASANSVSAASQAAQGAFNQASANNANLLGSQRLAEQYAFNTGQAEAANAFTLDMWNKTAEWNERMWDKTAAWNEKMFQQQKEFNAEEALKNRQWQENMSNTQYQRAIKDLEAAGLNPILAATSGFASGVGSGGSASTSAPSMGSASMSSAHGQMASGGLLGANQASEGMYTGQMEYMGGLLGLLASAFDGISSAITAMASNNTVKVVMENAMDSLFNFDKQKQSRDEDIKNNGAVNRYFRLDKNRK